jgi:hypothetical protein
MIEAVGIATELTVARQVSVAGARSRDQVIGRVL